MKKITPNKKQNNGGGSNKWAWLLVLSTLAGTVLDIVMIFNILV